MLNARENPSPEASSAACREHEPIPAFVLAKRALRLEALRESLDQALAAPGDVLIEFGCGHGHWLTDFAAAHPETLCLGLDMLSARVRKANNKRDRRGLDRLHFLKAEANELLSVWPDDRPIAHAFMLFPDPWPKKRHHKNRMIQAAFLERLAALMPVGGRFHFRTDDPDYFLWTQEHFEAHPAWWIDPHLPWPWERETVFQSKMTAWSSLIALRR